MGFSDRMRNLRKSLTTVLAMLAIAISAQSGQPQQFTIEKQLFGQLLEMPAGSEISAPANQYLDGSTVELNTLNGDMHFVRVRLKYFTGSYLLVQVNGIYTTQVFVMGKDSPVHYKGTITDGAVVMEKCSKDDIVNE